MSLGERWNKKFAESLTKYGEKSLQTLARIFQGARAIIVLIAGGQQNGHQMG